MTIKLIIGNKNYSSWSFRPWIAMRVAGIAFEEEVISLNADDFKQRVSRLSGTGKVPVLADGNVQVWESLAILGPFGAADAMFAPVVSRFHTYAVEVGAVARAYMEAAMALAAWREWRAAAVVEPWVLPEDEVDWPTVMRV
jgi:glutathione S-transferase